jgi:hypothetical protein
VFSFQWDEFQNDLLGRQIGLPYYPMSTVQECEHAAGRLSRADLIHLRAWLNDKIEGDLVVRDEVIDAIAQARGEIATGKATARKVL